MDRKNVPFIDVLIINGPVFLFFTGIALLAVLISRFSGLYRILCIAGIWWCLSGAVMLVIDFIHRKKSLYLRILRLAKADKARGLFRDLRQTVCGLCVYLAVQRRMRNS